MNKHFYYIHNINGFKQVKGYTDIDNNIGYHLIWKVTKSGKRYPNWWIATDLPSGLRICKAKRLEGCKEKVKFLKKDIEEKRKTDSYKEKRFEMYNYVSKRFIAKGISSNFYN